MLESSGFRKYSTLLVIQLFSRCLCLCHCLCIRLCLCVCVPYSFLNSYYQKLSENVWVWGYGASRSLYVTTAGQPMNKMGLLSQCNGPWKADMSNYLEESIPETLRCYLMELALGLINSCFRRKITRVLLYGYFLEARSKNIVNSPCARTTLPSTIIAS